MSAQVSDLVGLVNIPPRAAERQVVRPITIVMRRPTGKIRGFSRYLRALNSEAESYSLPLKDDNSFDLCHHHFDFWGYGRRNWTLRRLHLDALFVGFERALSQAHA